MNRRLLVLRVGALLAVLNLATTGHTATVKVNSLAALQTAIYAATPGDRIVLQNGIYTTTHPLTVANVATAAAPIVIAAESVGGVALGGSHGFMVARPAAHVVIEGFKFTHVAGRATIGAGTSHVRFTRNTFQCPGEGAELDVGGDDAEVDRNEFAGKKVVGNMLSVSGTEAQVARRLRLHHNYFHDYDKAGGNGAETLRFGRSWLSLSRADGIVEYNLFVRCIGENELITNKSSGNIYRYNTFLDSPGCQLTIRHGNDCAVYGNYFRNTDGLRIFGDRNTAVGNYFERNTRGINLGNGDGEVADGAKLTCHDRPDGSFIAFNTFLDNAVHYQMDNRKGGMGATHTTFAHNLIQGGGPATQIGGPNADAVWEANLFWKTGEIGQIPTGAYQTAERHFAVNANGQIQLDQGTVRPASETGVYPAAGPPETVSGKPGFAPPPATMARILSPADVGPASR